MNDELTIKGDIRRLSLQPGDMLVLQCDQRISTEVAARLRDQFTEAVPGHRVLVLDGSLSLTVCGPEGPFTPDHEPDTATLSDVLSAIQGIGYALAMLMRMLADESDDDEPQAMTLDGEPDGAVRDQSQSLG